MVHSYGDGGGYEQTTRGYVISFDGLGDSEMALFDAIDFLNRPATEDFASAKLAQLRAVMARGKESQGDIDLVIETYAEHVSQFPPDVVAYVVDRCIATKKWFPLVSELRAEMEVLVKFRRSILLAFEASRNPLIGSRPVFQIEEKKEQEPPKIDRPAMIAFLCEKTGNEPSYYSNHWFDDYKLAMIAGSQGYTTTAKET